MQADLKARKILEAYRRRRPRARAGSLARESVTGHFETKKPCRARVQCSSLAPLAADMRPECVVPSQRPTRCAIDNSPRYWGMLGNDDKRRIPKKSDSDMAVTVIGRHLMSTLFVYLVSEETPS
jgi:hypothetical protein